MCIPLDQFYPFGNATVSRGDDNSSPPISLQKEFLFFNQSHSELYVSYKPLPRYAYSTVLPSLYILYIG